jgi:hypothetical protein
MALSQVADVEKGLQICRIAANMLNEQSRSAVKGWSSGLWVERGPTTPHRKDPTYNKLLHRTAHLTGCCEHGYELSGFKKNVENFFNSRVTVGF